MGLQAAKMIDDDGDSMAKASKTKVQGDADDFTYGSSRCSRLHPCLQRKISGKKVRLQPMTSSDCEDVVIRAQPQGKLVRLPESSTIPCSCRNSNLELQVDGSFAEEVDDERTASRRKKVKNTVSLHPTCLWPQTSPGEGTMIT